MPLILAIEPHRRQAAQLRAIVKARLNAELVLADSAAHALAALGDRVPDLILTAALLPPKDEIALDERLRALEGAASHIQTLTIPLLAAPEPKKPEGMLASLRRGRARKAATDGCDPAVFADQCADYLERARVERENSEGRGQKTAAIKAQEPHDAPFDAPPMAQEAATEAAPAPVFEPEPVLQPVVISSQPDIDLSPPPPSLHDVPAGDEFVGASSALPAEPVDPASPVGVPDWPSVERSPVLDSQAPVATETAAFAPLEQLISPTDEKAAFVDELGLERTGEVPLSAAGIEIDPEIWAPRKPVTPLPSSPPDGASTQTEPTATRPDWVDAIESLRRDVERLRANRPQTTSSTGGATVSAPTAPEAPPPVRAEPTEADAAPSSETPLEGVETRTGSKRPKTSKAPAKVRAKGRKRPAKKDRALHDDWGFFDPAQCGFAKLVSKLDEITGDDDTPSDT